MATEVQVSERIVVAACLIAALDGAQRFQVHGVVEKVDVLVRRSIVDAARFPISDGESKPVLRFVEALQAMSHCVPDGDSMMLTPQGAVFCERGIAQSGREFQTFLHMVQITEALGIDLVAIATRLGKAAGAIRPESDQL